MQDVQTLMRCLLPPGRLETRTLWMLGSHRRLVRRWECDTDLPKPGPFPQISHTAAIVQAPQMFGGPALGRNGPGYPGQPRIPTVVGNHQNDQQLTPRLDLMLSLPLARLNMPVSPCRPAVGPDEAARRGVTVGDSDRLLDAPALRDWAHTAVSDL